jgi:hypothetical protein
VNHLKRPSWQMALIVTSILILALLLGGCDSTDGGPSFYVADRGSSLDGTIPPPGDTTVIDVGGGLLVNNPAPAATNWIGYEDTVLVGVGAPRTQTNRGTLADWSKHEKPSWDSSPPNNPLNTTLKEPGSWGVVQTETPGVMVQGYPTLAEGAQATISMLNEPRYTELVGELRESVPTPQWGGAARAEVHTWGTQHWV